MTDRATQSATEFTWAIRSLLTFGTTPASLQLSRSSSTIAGLSKITSWITRAITFRLGEIILLVCQNLVTQNSPIHILYEAAIPHQRQLLQLLLLRQLLRRQYQRQRRPPRLLQPQVRHRFHQQSQ